uniref:Rubredoxin-like domain-containing protein n=1 Tax=Pseudo-nitzschia delicatissima TaxID=44447 RepID=A0A7S0UH78_9STRA|mmetsp:Transcript_4284/g.8914  ORF Transcript_4284/g.8914 Transcript_4284/m.8914 type:complete len:119 (+) Transcript_4284:93-449(+)
MKSTTLFSLLSVLLGVLMMPLTATAFAPAARGVSIGSITSASTETTTQLFFFGKPKDDGSPGDYVCKDCGYVFTKGPQAWAALDDKYKCPPCGAPKFRFNKVPKGSASGKVEVKKSWF